MVRLRPAVYDRIGTVTEFVPDNGTWTLNLIYSSVKIS